MVSAQIKAQQPQTGPPEEGFPIQDIEYFQINGFVIVRRLADPALVQEILQASLAGLARPSGPMEYEAEVQYPGAPLSLAAQGGRTIRRLKQALSRDCVFMQWVSHPGLVSRLQQLLGPHVTMPLAHHNCIMTKQPRYSSDTRWHQDIRFWSFQRSELVSVWLALGREYPENGTLKLIPGSHRMEFDRSRLDEALFLKEDHPENLGLIENCVYAELEPGDALFFHCRTFHAASRNHTFEPKLSAVFTFRPADNPPISGTRSASQPELVLPVWPQDAALENRSKA